jgi:hypothetical protein
MNQSTFLTAFGGTMLPFNRPSWHRSWRRPPNGFQRFEGEAKTVISFPKNGWRQHVNAAMFIA